MRLVVVIKGGLCYRLITDTEGAEIAIVDCDDDSYDRVKGYMGAVEVDAELTDRIFTSDDEQLAALDL